MKRFSLKYLLLLIALIAVIFWFSFSKSQYTAVLPNNTAIPFSVGFNVSIIHSTKGDKIPVFYVKNEPILDMSNSGSTCEFTFRASNLTKVKLWMQGYENLMALPGTHD